MKRLLILSLILLLSISCSKSNNGYVNPYLPNYPVNKIFGFNFYDSLRYAHSSAIERGQGSGGMDYGAIIVFNIGSDQYRAYDLMCPNHQIHPSCSRMTLEKPGSIYVVCHCVNEHDEPMKYSLITGMSMTPGAKYQMKPYNAQKQGDAVRVWY